MTSEPSCGGRQGKRFSNDFNWQKARESLTYHPLHCGSEVRWSYRSSVIDHADVVVLPLPLIVVEWRKKKQQR